MRRRATTPGYSHIQNPQMTTALILKTTMTHLWNCLSDIIINRNKRVRASWECIATKPSDRTHLKSRDRQSCDTLPRPWTVPAGSVDPLKNLSKGEEVSLYTSDQSIRYRAKPIQRARNNGCFSKIMVSKLTHQSVSILPMFPSIFHIIISSCCLIKFIPHHGTSETSSLPAIISCIQMGKVEALKSKRDILSWTSTCIAEVL